jgi:hypothetical protein
VTTDYAWPILTPPESLAASAITELTPDILPRRSAPITAARRPRLAARPSARGADTEPESSRRLLDARICRCRGGAPDYSRDPLVRLVCVFPPPMTVKL